MSTIKNYQIYSQSARYGRIPSKRKQKQKRRSRQILEALLLVFLVMCCIAGIQLMKLYATDHTDAPGSLVFSSSFLPNGMEP